MTKTASRRRAAPDRRQRLVLVVAGVGVIALAVLIGALTAGGAGSAPTLDEVAGNPTIEGQPLPPASGSPADDPGVGAQAPVVSGAGFDGTPTAIGAPGRAQLIVFMAAWCPHCQDELPELAEWLASDQGPGDVDVVAVATGLDPSRPNWPPADWFARENYPGPVLVDDADGAVGRAYGLTGTPYWVGLDADGQVVIRVAGRIGMDAVDRLAGMVTEAG